MPQAFGPKHPYFSLGSPGHGYQTLPKPTGFALLRRRRRPAAGKRGQSVGRKNLFMLLWNCYIKNASRGWVCVLAWSGAHAPVLHKMMIAGNLTDHALAAGGSFDEFHPGQGCERIAAAGVGKRDRAQQRRRRGTRAAESPAVPWEQRVARWRRGHRWQVNWQAGSTGVRSFSGAQHAGCARKGEARRWRATIAKSYT